VRDDRRSSRGPREGLSLTYEGTEYAFCGKGCLLEFRDEPAKYLDAGYTPSM
jgi:hypothetical protein